MIELSMLNYLNITKKLADSEYISQGNDVCLLCLDNLNENLTTIKTNCGSKCRVLMHQECYNKILSNGLQCPICRFKINKNQTIFSFESEPVLLNFPIYLFSRYPNFLTFLLFIIFSFAITLFFILPMLIYYALRERRFKNNSLINAISIMFCFFIYFYSSI